MRQFLLIKTGSTLPSLRASKGDFEEWTLAGMGLGGKGVLVVDVRDGSPLPVYDELSGGVVTGSHSMVTDYADWSERTAVWLASAVEQQIPILGICYGHQLLAYALGGQVGDNPNGHEYGTVEIRLSENAQATRAYIHHSRSVLLAERQDPDRLIEQSMDTLCGSQILERFFQFANRRGR